MKLDTLISRGMLDQNLLLHMDGNYGRSGWHHTLSIVQFAQKLGATSILDYGCGRSTLRKSMEAWDDLREYDPAIKKHSVFPDRADLVVCTDVLEHVEKNRLSNVVNHLVSLSIMGCFIVVATRASDKQLSDGRDTHLIVRPVKWWTKKLARPQWVMERHQDVRKKDESPHELRMWFVRQ